MPLSCSETQISSNENEESFASNETELNFMDILNKKILENFQDAKDKFDYIKKIFKAYTLIIKYGLNQENAVDRNWLSEQFDNFYSLALEGEDNYHYKIMNPWVNLANERDLTFEDFKEFDEKFFHFIQYHEDNLRDHYSSSISSSALMMLLDYTNEKGFEKIKMKQRNL